MCIDVTLRMKWKVVLMAYWICRDHTFANIPLHRVVSCRVIYHIPYHTIWYHIYHLSFIISRHIISHHITSHLTTPHHTPHHTTPHHNTTHHIIYHIISYIYHIISYIIYIIAYIIACTRANSHQSEFINNGPASQIINAEKSSLFFATHICVVNPYISSVALWRDQRDIHRRIWIKFP